MSAPAPGARALQRHLRRHRTRMPRAFRASLAVGLGLVAAYALVQLALQATDPALARGLLRLFLLTVVAGREPALFDAYQAEPPVPLAWASAMALLDDWATLFLAAPLAWLLVDRLRRVPALDALLRSFEHALNAHRAAVDRWGVAALAAFLWLPGWGTGPSLSVAMGVLAGIPTVRLLVALAASCAGVNLFWAVTLAGAAEAAPDRGAWDALPLALVGLLAAAGLVAALRQRHRRFVLEYPVPPGGAPPRLAAWGFERRGGVLRLDARRLEAAGGPSARHLAASHWAGELLLLPSMTPAWAGRLAALRVTGVHDLALLPPALLAGAMGMDMGMGPSAGTGTGPGSGARSEEGGGPGAPPVRRWVEEAQALLASGYGTAAPAAPG